MRKMARATPEDIEEDFKRRVTPGLKYCQRVGNIMGATTMLSVASSIDNGDFAQPRRIGCFSYGSGCCSEFFSGVVSKEGQERLQRFRIHDQLDRRQELSMEEYDNPLIRQPRREIWHAQCEPGYELYPAGSQHAPQGNSVLDQDQRISPGVPVAILNRTTTDYETLRVRFEEDICYLQIYRPEANNTINDRLVEECGQLLELCRENAKIVILEGLPEVFCFGADFQKIQADLESTSHQAQQDPELIYNLWLQLARGPDLTIAHVRGKANAGGIGFVAACDVRYW